MSSYANLPAPTPEQGLNRYMQEIRKFPMLEPDEEYMLAKRWVDHEDTEAAHKDRVLPQRCPSFVGWHSLAASAKA